MYVWLISQARAHAQNSSPTFHSRFDLPKKAWRGLLVAHEAKCYEPSLHNQARPYDCKAQTLSDAWRPCAKHGTHSHTLARVRFSSSHSNNSKHAFIFIGHANSSEPACRKRSMGRNEKQGPSRGEKYQTPAALMHLQTLPFYGQSPSSDALEHKA